MMLVDVQQDVENCGSAENVAAVCQEQRIESLPAALQFAHALPAHSKVGCIAMEKGHGKLDVIKLVTFQDKMAIRDATKIPAGSAYVPFSRPGPWAVKKAFQSLLDRLPGHHVHWGTVTRWEAQAKNSASSSSTWSPDTLYSKAWPLSMTMRLRRMPTMSSIHGFYSTSEKMRRVPLLVGQKAK